MIIKYEKGDLVTMIRNSLAGTQPPIQVAHGCNCRKTMGAGIALAFKEFPEIADADRIHPNPTLGEMSIAPITTLENFPEFVATVYNLYTQQAFGRRHRQVNYGAIAQCFASLDSEIPVGDVLYIPRIGAGLGGGDWNIIEQIINDVTPFLDIMVIDYMPNIDPRENTSNDKT